MEEFDAEKHVFVEEYRGNLVVRIVCPKCSREERYDADTIKSDHVLKCPSCGETVTLVGDGIPKLCKDLNSLGNDMNNLFK